MNHKRRRNTKTKKSVRRSLIIIGAALQTRVRRIASTTPQKNWYPLSKDTTNTASKTKRWRKEDKQQKNNNKGCLYHTETLTARSLDLALIIFLVFAVGRPTSSSMKTLPYFSLGLATAVLLGTEKTTFLTLGTTTRLYICSMGRSSQ